MPYSWLFYVDWNNDLDVADASEDVTARVYGDRVNVVFGMDTARPLTPPRLGTLELTLDNTSGDYYPENSGSSLYGSVLPGRPVWVGVDTDEDSTVDTWMFKGRMVDLVFDPRDTEPVYVTCLAGWRDLTGVTIDTQVYESVDTGTLIGNVLDAAGWPAGSTYRDIATGVVTPYWWWADNTTAWDALVQLLQLEGPGALMTVTGDGKFTFKNRHHRIVDTRSTNVQQTFVDSTQAEG